MSTNTGLRAARAEAGARPGLMTTAMRALPDAGGPRVLRIGKIEAGRVIEERLLRRRAQVTVGTGHDNTLVATGAGVPETMRLFEPAGDHYVLRLNAATRGRVALASGIVDVSEARPRGAIELGDDARGKVVVGDTTFLFQMVAPPPLQAKPQLPISVTGAAGREIDWAFTIVAACSFLLHFGFASAVNGEWFDPIVDDEQGTAQLVQSVRDHGAPPPLEPQRPDVRPDAKVVVAEGPKTSAPSDPRRPAPTVTTTAQAPGPSRTAKNDESAARLGAQADRIFLDLIGTPGETDSAVTSTLRPGSLTPMDQVDEVARQTPDGVATSGPRLRNQDGPKHDLPSTGDPTLVSTGPRVTPTATTTASAVVGPVAPQIAQTEPTTIAPGVPGADAVVNRNRWRFRGCYTKALLADPDAGGTVNVTVNVNAEGKVTSASGSGGAPSTLGTCTAGAFVPMEFPAPAGGSATFNVKIVFASKR